MINVLKDVFYIYSKQIKKKKLYYFMKFCNNTSLLGNKYNKLKKNKVFNRLYNNYFTLNQKKIK